VTVILDPDQVAGSALADCYLTADRSARDPWVLANMVSSVDGAAMIDGRSTALGGSEDRRIFKVIRSVADVIIVGAATVRAENYGAPSLTEELRERRVRAGRDPVPRVAVVSGRLDLDLGSSLFTEHRPFVLTTEEGAAAASSALRDAADVLVCGSGRIDPAAAITGLAARGAGVILSEGGPSLNGQLLAADLLDEFCLTLDPSLAGGESGRIVHGEGPSVVHRMTPAHVALSGDGVLFLRYVRSIGG
jgi:riboflavin-specific deaminase-like protein